MNKRILATLMCICCITLFFAGCEKKEEPQQESKETLNLPVEEINPDIQDHSGMFLEANGKPAAQGGVVSIGKDYDFMKIMIEGKEYEFKLTETSARPLKIWTKDTENPKVKRGTILLFHYEEKDGVFTATEILSTIEANMPKTQ